MEIKWGVCEKVHFLKVNKRGVQIRSGGFGKNGKIDKRGGTFIWHLRVHVSGIVIVSKTMAVVHSLIFEANWCQC